MMTVAGLTSPATRAGPASGPAQAMLYHDAAPFRTATHDTVFSPAFRPRPAGRPPFGRLSAGHAPPPLQRRRLRHRRPRPDRVGPVAGGGVRGDAGPLPVVGAAAGRIH